ncbi:ECF family RNA polymerase sigma factor [Myxococcus stipitatus DSM 14675]|uniref:ECF family RNA polymerase sigma factor n=1 Tax=Myxococcus stipitatus (strain DSM 14675 / JCM 12634 / Mx s8) TaxID=1278073 RepID=L7UG81_MYXSD|nr:sigma-70 family RNA polymerase sigma factor [Myxococcus stipitatus]AGC47033.1 ECF family RNA polymerase sigma factor [Myxococcus stipitatus DSM 14675]
MGAAHTELLAAAARGDDEALAVLVRAYHDRVYRFGLRVCRDGFDADDAVQEAFTKLARRPEVQRDAGVLSWLMSVVRHACLRMLRPFVRERRALGAGAEEEAVLAPEGVDPQQALERWELIQSVHAAIAGLAPAYREVLIMRDLEGLSGDEVCKALGLELATMKTRLHRARGQLREELLRRGAWQRPEG